MPKRARTGETKDEFKPQVRSARTIIDAIAFLQKTGFATTPANIKTCIVQRCRKPADHVMTNLTNYLTRGLELGILKKRRGNYKLETDKMKQSKKRVKSRITKTKSTRTVTKKTATKRIPR